MFISMFRLSTMAETFNAAALVTLPDAARLVLLLALDLCERDGDSLSLVTDVSVCYGLVHSHIMISLRQSAFYKTCMSLMCVFFLTRMPFPQSTPANNRI